MSRRRRMSGLCVVAALSTICAGTLWAKPGIVHTLDNGAYSGDVTEQGQYVVITVHGIRTQIDRRNVRFPIEYVASLDDQYEQAHAKLTADDVKGRQALADAMLQNGRADLAVKALTEAAAIAPSSRDVALELQSAQKQMELDQRGKTVPHASASAGTLGEKPSTMPSAAGSQPSTEPAMAKLAPHRLLTLAEVNRIRQYELPGDDTTTRVRFDNDVVARYVKENNLNLTEFRQMDALRQAQTILAAGDAKMAADVHLLTDSAPLLQFKNRVLPIIMAGCANSGCHGGTHAGSFGLYIGQSPNVLYTNFYILQAYAKSFAGVQFMAMDRNYPDRSLVLQFAIPGNQALVVHPNVPGYHPRFKSPTDPGYKTIFDWITALRPIEPQYGIDVSPSIPLAEPAGNTPKPE